MRSPRRTVRTRLRGMSRVLPAVALWMGVACIAAGSANAAQRQSSTSTPFPGSQYQAVLDHYCVTCHNERLKTAGLILDNVDVRNPPAGAEVWEKVIRKLRTGTMPPPVYRDQTHRRTTPSRPIWR